MNRLTRRLLLTGALGAAPALAGCSTLAVPAAPADPTVAATGRTQAGVARPETPQRHLNLAVFNLAEPTLQLRRIGDAIRALASGQHAGLAGLAPGDLTMTAGLGPRLVAAVASDLPGAADLPAFARETVPDSCRGGDLLLQVCGSDPLVVSTAAAALAGVVSAPARWAQGGFHTDRNLVGFLDGTENPHGSAIDREVWLDAPARLAGATVAVVRRIRMDVSGFLAQSVDQQERAVGRRRADGRPLSGGTVDLEAKTADGRYLLPVDSHVRRAHRSATGSGMMLRRGYSYDNGPGDQGLLFVSFQRELRTFTATQYRLDEGDALMAFTTVTASGTFLILPGFDADRPLGSPLLG